MKMAVEAVRTKVMGYKKAVNVVKVEWAAAADRRRQRVSTSSGSSESDAVVETDSEYDHHVNSDRIPESLDMSCIFFEASYFSDRHGEEWIQCQSCNLWAHTAEGEYYICDFCR